MTAGHELDDIQALVRTGFGSLGGARYLLLRIADPASVKPWLTRLEPTRASQVGSGKQIERALQIAFTRAGLEALGFGEDALAAFAPEFLDGMASDPGRSHRLGDEGASAPDQWEWGRGEREPHILLLVLAKKSQIDDWARSVEAEALAAGCTCIDAFDSCPAREDGEPSHEPFGFADGLSQPDIDWDGTLAVTGAVNRDYRPAIAAGDVLLGHVNEYSFVADYPQGPLVGRNGSYLVYRQLAQDVPGFWQWAAETVGPDRAIWFAERVVGRQVDGSPLPGLGAGKDNNDFLFKDDPEGITCPFGAHIRRANPRSGDDPLGRRGFLRDLIATAGLEGTAAADAVASARFHRLLRRGRPYGTTISIEQAMRPDQPKIDAGLHFVCLNASLARQFEFVQGAWVMSATFGGLSQEGDPLLGNRLPFPDQHRTDLFRYRDEQGAPRIVQGIPSFVTVRGGAYFFLPGIAGLRSIAAA
jgi:Dyp-type peroxidase family